MATPEFPLRIIFDDGEVEEIESADDLLEKIDTIDSTNRDSCIWIRDAEDRTVLMRIRSGIIELFETA